MYSGEAAKLNIFFALPTRTATSLACRQTLGHNNLESYVYSIPKAVHGCLQVERSSQSLKAWSCRE
jgi:hypothetical protein